MLTSAASSTPSSGQSHKAVPSGDAETGDGTVVPLCPFVAGWISRHEEYADLVDQAALDYLDQ